MNGARPTPGLSEERFRDTILEDGILTAGDSVLVAVSGGLDSTVLLHLLRHTPGLPRLRLSAAHFDHRMREGSGPDARWVRGLTRAWDVELTSGSTQRVLGNEAEAREARYRFLEDARRQTGSEWVVTAHHADDQAETVLHRALRGTGLTGLAGIPRVREPGVYRPMLSFWRSEIAAYAQSRGLRFRTDPTNLSMDTARNVLRHEILPLAEARVAPGARRALNRLGTLAAEEDRLWKSVVTALLGGLDVERDGDDISFARDPFLVYDRTVQARLLRGLAEERGAHLDAAGTTAAVEFTTAAASGRALCLPSGLVLSRSFGRITIARREEERGTRPVTLEGPGDGVASGLLGGEVFRARWSMGGAVEGERFSVPALRFPLTLRGWRPGDRILLPYGTKKLKKLFGEARIPRERRGRIPVVVDADDHVLWVPGLARSVEAVPVARDPVLYIGVDLNDDDV